ncbi:hypothetical protein AURDEDRAFT_40538, partial [Auricularia subglabra TFB-10046 SS5]
IVICDCRPAVDQLLARGYFPCAPLAPSMAFSLELLHFISIHSLLVAPNITAWAETLETFWSRNLTIYLTVQGRLRKRLGTALTWYQVMVNKAELAVASELQSELVVSCTQSTLMWIFLPNKEHATQPATPAEAPSHDPDEPPARKRARRAEEADEPPARPARAPEGNDSPLRPSYALRQKCPICFGGDKPQLLNSRAHIIVCIDANFAHKRRKCADGDPPLDFLPSRFVSEAEASVMAAEVERMKARPPKRRTKGAASRLPDEVLDECEKSFLAAQEKVTKASKNYYADTGLMALNCRHDRVLWVVNMTTAGERQFYALALLRKLGEELPAEWCIGLLYDIGCQISRSIEKWSFLPELADRLVFAVSVFHAYGHQWECQVVFHPRKCEGFGLTDGEGCERFWSSIRHLIACLRVSGFHRRLFVLDRQMDALARAGLWKLGVWLRRKRFAAERRLAEAQGVIRGRGVAREVLRAEWAQQVAAQLEKPARKSAKAGDAAIDEILIALGTIQDYKQEIRDSRKDLRKAHALTAGQTEALEASIDGARRGIEATETRILKLHETLGTERCRRLDQMRGNAYICARVNARAARASIRQSLVKHKFEHRKVERAYRHQARVHAQTKEVIHRRERGISAQVSKYNGYVDQMRTLAAQGKKPPGRAPLPRKLDAKKLFKLDVDDDIWQEDPGLGPQDEDALPRWQTDEDVKRGIVALLEEDRCIEELERLNHEVDALAKWWLEE